VAGPADGVGGVGAERDADALRELVEHAPGFSA
jgi:hypothetical protein